VPLPPFDTIETLIMTIKSDARTAAFQGCIVEVSLGRCTLPNGHAVELEVIHHPGGAAVVALDTQGRVCLLYQYRPVAENWLWELPAGKIDLPEEPLNTARRELIEEAGVSARQWQPLGAVYSSPGIFTEIIHLYLATDLQPEAQALEHGELLEVHWVPLQQALEWAASGRICDAKTLIGLFRAAAILQSPESQQSPAALI
jgi:8-oxo-dGTP pyrophosphatase MutT (NUDIX family)